MRSTSESKSHWSESEPILKFTLHSNQVCRMTFKVRPHSCFSMAYSLKPNPSAVHIFSVATKLMYRGSHVPKWLGDDRMPTNANMLHAPPSRQKWCTLKILQSNYCHRGSSQDECPHSGSYLSPSLSLFLHTPKEREGWFHWVVMWQTDGYGSL